MITALTIALAVILVITSVLLVVLILIPVGVSVFAFRRFQALVGSFPIRRCVIGFTSSWTRTMRQARFCDPTTGARRSGTLPCREAPDPRSASTAPAETSA